MIIFKETKNIREDHFLVFANDKGSSIDIPVSEDTKLLFLRYFDRLSPPTKSVEETVVAASK